MAKALERNAGGVFDLTTVDSRDDAVNQIRTRDAYGAVILDQQPEVLDGGANGAAITRILKGVSQQLQGQLAQAVDAAHQAAPEVAFTGVVPLVEADPNGTGFTLAAFPLTMGGVLGGGVITLCMQAMHGVLQGNPLLGVVFTLAGHFRNQEVVHVAGYTDAADAGTTAKHLA